MGFHYWFGVYTWFGICFAITLLIMSTYFVIHDNKNVTAPDDKLPWWIIPIMGLIGLLLWPVIFITMIYYEIKDQKRKYHEKKQKDKIHEDLCAWLDIQAQNPNNCLIANVSSEVYRNAADILAHLDYAPEFAAPTFRNSIQFEWGGDDKPYMEIEIFENVAAIFVLRPEGIMAKTIHEARDHSINKTVPVIDYKSMNQILNAYKDGLYDADKEDYTATDINEE